MKAFFIPSPLPFRQTLRCAESGDYVNRLRKMQHELKIRRSDLRARGIRGNNDNIDSRLDFALGPTEVAQEANSQKMVHERTRTIGHPAEPIPTDTSYHPVSEGFVYPMSRRIVEKIDGSLPLHRKRPPSTIQQCELGSFASFIGDHFERCNGGLPRKENEFANIQRCPPLQKDRLGMSRGALLESLSEEQRNAVLVHPSEACLVLAGPGSGKTKVLTHRFAYLVEKHQVSPYNILAVTFTNKAASEMNERLMKLLIPGKSEEGRQAFMKKLTVGTYHSICARLLRKYGERIGLSREFEICDSTDSRAILTQVMKSTQKVDTVDPRTVGQTLAMISKIKNSTLEEATMEPIGYKRNCDLRILYDEALKQANRLDFDDLLLETRHLLQDCPDVLEELQNRYENVLVDEWQDTSLVQFDILSLLARRRKNLFVVGDVDQSIYKFRGADHRNLQTFSERFPDAVQVTLERNYRSSRCIVEAAQSVINEDKKRPRKRMITTNEFGNKIVLRQTRDCRREAMFVISQLKHLKHSGELERFSDAAVMYRTNAQSRQLEEAFMRADLPYRLHSGVRFYERAEIKDILGYIKLIYNPRDDISFRRIVNTPPRGIGKRTIDAIEEYAKKENLSLLDAVFQMIKSSRENGDELSLRPQMVRSLTCVYNLLYRLRRCASSLSADKACGAMPDSRHSQDQFQNMGELVATVVEETGYREFLKIPNCDGHGVAEKKLQQQANVEELIQSASRHKDVRGFLDTVALMTNTDHNDQTIRSRSGEISLMTLHSGKGLEFKAVFIVGAEDNVIPTVRHGANHRDIIDEERRLLYVGMTRAKSFLFITWRKSKPLITRKSAMKREVMSLSTANPSRFLQAIPKTTLVNHVT